MAQDESQKPDLNEVEPARVVRIDPKPLVRAFANMPRGQELLPAEIAAKIPGHRATADQKLEDIVAHVHFFTPISNFDWYVLEYDEPNRLLYCLTVGFDADYGDVSLDELESMNALVERDEWFDPAPLQEVWKELAQKRPDLAHKFQLDTPEPEQPSHDL